MKFIFAALPMSLTLLCASAQATDIAIPSYWGASGAYDQIPAGAIAVINPNSGILDGSRQSFEVASSAEAYRPIVAEMTARGVDVFAYVPTGYFKHDCDVLGECQTFDRIAMQLSYYSVYYSDLAGVFFDEAAGANADCDDYSREYSGLRKVVDAILPDVRIAFNPGFPSECAVAAAHAGDTILTYEGDLLQYEAPNAEWARVETLADATGVETWHLVYGVKTQDRLSVALETGRSRGADYLYVTDVGGDWRNGENTWGAPPVYWSEQVEAFSQR